MYQQDAELQFECKGIELRVIEMINKIHWGECRLCVHFMILCAV